jgi:hypothetical protein
MLPMLVVIRIFYQIVFVFFDLTTGICMGCIICRVLIHSALDS